MSKLSDFRTAAAEKRPRAQVETFHRGQAAGAVHNAMPTPLVTLSCLIGSGSIVGLMYFAGDLHGGEGGGARWAMATIAVLTVLSLAALGWRHHKAGKAARETVSLEDAVKQSAAGGDPGGSADEAAKMDDLRDEFRKGVDTFTRYGKSLYSYPWYVLAGEPGSGKSEAVRRSELKFPDQLQNKMQGVGGTVSMHWWFTNQAIIIDTAGALLTRPEAAQRFREFLHLLKSHRPDCPINGMVLTIPVDSLQVDDANAIERKAAGIAAQLGIIQQTLDVRFPVYLMISKSDRLPGWREFFDAPGQAKFERQMMGWANPDPLDAPFDPARVSEAIGEIADRLRRRSLALLSDPTPRQQDGRRTDEVDALYTFPGHLLGLVPGLIRYLEIIFETGEWSSKPPFFRGIFFTSALQEGAQLDTELARMLDIPVESLPSEGVYVREKAVFLRDFFLEKIFPEQGLVTRLTSVSSHLRRKLAAFYGITLALMLLLAGWALLMKFSLQKQMREEDAYWAAVNANWSNGALLPVVEAPQDTGSPSRVFLDKPVTLNRTSRGEMPRTELLGKLLDKALKPLDFSVVFRPVGIWRDYEDRRRQAALTVCENSLFKPLVDAARARMIREAPYFASLDKEGKNRMIRAFGQLALLESWIAGAGKAPEKPDWEEFFAGLTAYVGADWVTLETQTGAPSPSADGTADPGKDAPGADGKETVVEEKNRQQEDLQAVKRMSELAVSLPSHDGGSFVKGRAWLSEDTPASARGALASVLPLLQSAWEKVGSAQDQAAKTRRSLQEQDQAWMAECAKLKNPEITAEEADDSLKRLKECLPGAELAPDAQNLPDSSVIAAALAHANMASGAGEQPDPPLPGLAVLMSRRPEIRSMLEKSGGSNAGIPPEDYKKWEQRKADLADFLKAFQAKKADLSKLAIGRLGLVLNEAKKQEGNIRKPEEWVNPGASDEVKTICANLQKHQGRKMENDILVSYVGKLKESLRENIRWPLVRETAKPYTEQTFQADELGEYFREIQKDRDAVRNLPEASSLGRIFSACAKSYGILQALTGNPYIIFPDPPPAKDIEALVADPSGQPVTGKVPSGFQRLVFYHPANSGLAIGKGRKPWRIFASVGYKATFAEQGGREKNVAGVTFFPLEELILRPGGGWDFRLRFNDPTLPGTGEMEGITIETTPRLPVGSWPSRKDFNLPPQ